MHVPYLAEEIELILKNLLIYLHHIHRDIIYEYFIEETRAEVIRDKYDEKNNRIICNMDKFIEEDDREDIGLEGAYQFMKEQKINRESKAELTD